mgnify:CR=1 FL=1|tara:strand:+ start:1308 stop:1532 length:225 start_codon:yes stop_codon:yes gene_type:complete
MLTVEKIKAAVNELDECKIFPCDKFFIMNADKCEELKKFIAADTMAENILFKLISKFHSPLLFDLMLRIFEKET